MMETVANTKLVENERDHGNMDEDILNLRGNW